MILTPSKKIIRPRQSFRTFEDLRRHKQVRESNIAMDLHATIAVSEKGRCLGKETFRCHSFNANWMKIMKMLATPCLGTITNAVNLLEYTAGYTSYNNLLIGQVSSTILGPVIGTGTTAQTANDVGMEQQITSGNAAPNASVITGTLRDSVTNISTIYDNGGKSFTNDQYNQYILEITSGAFNGQERIIYDTYDSGTYDYLAMYAASNGTGLFASASPLFSATYKIKTYGMMVYGTVGFTAPEDDGDLTSTMTITRSFANGCGETLDVTEFGLQVRMDSDTGSSNFICPLVIRDVRETPVSIANGQELTLTYTFACEA